MASSKGGSGRGRPRRPPGSTPEARENQLIAKAIDLAEEQIEKGIVSAQVLSHFLKLATTREQLEQERLRRENKLLEAKVDNLESAARIEELYDKAIKAMRVYQGNPDAEGLED